MYIFLKMVMFCLLHYLCNVLLTYVLRKPWFWSLEEAGQWRDVSGAFVPLCCHVQSYSFLHLSFWSSTAFVL